MCDGMCTAERGVEQRNKQYWGGSWWKICKLSSLEQHDLKRKNKINHSTVVTRVWILSTESH